MKRSITKVFEQHARASAPSPNAPPFRVFSSKEAAAAFGVGVSVFLDFSWIICAICVLCAAINAPIAVDAVRTAAPKSALAFATFAGAGNLTRPSGAHVAADLAITAAIAATTVLCAFLFSASATAADMAAQTAADYSVRLVPPRAGPRAGPPATLHAAALAARAGVGAVLAEHGGASCVAHVALHLHGQRVDSFVITLRSETQKAALLSFYSRGLLCRRAIRHHFDSPVAAAAAAAAVASWTAEAAHEPSDIIWKNAHRSASERYARAAASFAACTVMAALAFAAIAIINPETKAPTVAGIAAGFTIALINGMIPSVAFVIAAAIERPATHSEKHAMEMYKLTAIRVFNSAFMLFFLTPNAQFLASNTQEQIAAIIIIDAAVGIAGRMIRPIAVAAACVRAPAAARALARPIRWSLPDRYADIIKFFTISTAFAFTAPAACAIAALAIAAGRIIDAYDVAHRWAAPPKTDYALSAIALHFIALAGFAHSWISLWAYQRWPFAAGTTDAHKSPFAANAGRAAKDGTAYAYYAAMAVFVCITAGDIAAKIARAALAHACCGAAQRRRPLSTRPFREEEHGHYAPAPGALFQFH
jgi:hypothetical protein